MNPITNRTETKIDGGGELYNHGGASVSPRFVLSSPPHLNNDSFFLQLDKNTPIYCAYKIKANSKCIDIVRINSAMSKYSRVISILHNIHYRTNNTTKRILYKCR